MMNPFRRASVRYGRTPEPETPYQKAAQVWDERIGSARVQAKNWRLMAFGSLILSAGLSFALVWQSTSGTIVPWVVQIDKLGEAQAVAPAIADYRPTDPQIAWHLARFIEQVRAIPADAVIVRQNWLRAYEFTTDRGGQVTAQVTEHVYDTPTGKFLLIPQGARLIGQYDSQIAFGQKRVLLVWNRIILPNGKSIVLERQQGADAQGFSGLEDEVDYHWWDLAKAAALSTLLGIGTELGSNSNESDLVRALRRGSQDSINNTGQQLVRRQLNIQPTLTIRQGFPVRVIVNRDLVFR